MGLLSFVSKLLQGGSLPDPFTQNPQAAELVASVKRADMSTTTPMLSGLRDDAWSDRAFFLDAIAPHCMPEVLDAWCQNDAQNPIAFLLRGVKHIDEAWEARGHGHAKTVSTRGRKLMAQHLGAAQEHLEAAAALDAADPTPHSYLISVAMGQSSSEEAGHHFQQAVERDGQHYPAHAAMLKVVCKKWGGSHEQMFDFARHARDATAEGGDLPLILVNAHIERWLYSYNFDNDVQGAEAWIGDPQVQQEAQHAWSISLGSPSYQPGPWTPHRRNEAAFWFYLVRDIERLRQEMSELHNVCTEVPWGWDHLRGSAVESYKAARGRMAGLK